MSATVSNREDATRNPTNEGFECRPSTSRGWHIKYSDKSFHSNPRVSSLSSYRQADLKDVGLVITSRSSVPTSCTHHKGVSPMGGFSQQAFTLTVDSSFRKDMHAEPFFDDTGRNFGFVSGGGHGMAEYPVPGCLGGSSTPGHPEERQEATEVRLVLHHPQSWVVPGVRVDVQVLLQEGTYPGDVPRLDGRPNILYLQLATVFPCVPTGRHPVLNGGGVSRTAEHREEGNVAEDNSDVGPAIYSRGEMNKQFSTHVLSIEGYIEAETFILPIIVLNVAFHRPWLNPTVRFGVSFRDCPSISERNDPILFSTHTEVSFCRGPGQVLRMPEVLTK
ncbi:hypothetical protein AAG570_007458 [Ranatra chinensis]|uniref:Uncharacterized protein n=1 Tax=Ranatra chinensis TaxID=642074 RepID=A0ABD0Y8X6_9HEMI